METFNWYLSDSIGENQPFIKACLLERMPMEQELLPAVLICPGGGYTHLSPREAEPVALAFAAKGYQTFILHYSLLPKHYPQPLLDAANAMSTIRKHAKEWRVDPNRIAMCGFSAGGHLTAVTSTLANSPILQEAGFDTGDVRPNAAILCYGVTGTINMTTEEEKSYADRFLGEDAANPELQKIIRLYQHVTPNNPPTFLWHTAADTRVPVENSLSMAMALSAQKVPFELHVFPEGRHGLSLANERTFNGDPNMIRPEVAKWFELCCDWLQRTLNK